MNLLFEIGTEELPPGEIDGAIAALAAHITRGAEAARLPIGAIRTYATARRMAICVADVASEAETIEETLTGPAAKIAFDADGNPTKAAIGFARGKGIDPADLIRVTTDRGEYVAAKVRQEGQPAAEVLTEVLNGAFAAIRWKKAMRWGWASDTFGRPVHWIVALLDDAVLDVAFADVKAGRQTRGHRFLSPEPADVTADSYADVLRDKYVVADVEERRTTISNAITQLAEDAGLVAIADPDLVDEVIYLVEWPVPLLGHFPEELLEVPREVLIESMRSHQRYFATEDASGALANGFVFVSNMVVPDPDVVVRGNLRVLLARLEDAKFFYREDQKKTLDARVDQLATIRYIRGLGSLRDRTARVEALAAKLAEALYPGDAATAATAGRAAHLCKADLTSGMVYEFPSLQGVMGDYYARLAGESGDVARAIRDHYAPRGASDAPPSTPAGIVVGLADKLDAIAGCFALGLVPSGSADPYALRRAALGVLRTCIDAGLRLSLTDAVDWAVAGLPTEGEDDVTLRPADEVSAQAVGFIETRLRAMLAADAPTDIADAVVARIGDDLPSAPARAATLDEMRRNADFDPLAAAYKRTVNILADAESKGGLPRDTPDAAGFVDDAERALNAATEDARPQVAAAIEAGEFAKVGELLIGLKPAIDGFFNDVMVNAEDADVRANRLALLNQVRALFSSFADISRIQVEGK